MPKSAKSAQSGYVISADANVLPEAINTIVTGEDVTNYMHLKLYAIYTKGLDVIEKYLIALKDRGENLFSTIMQHMVCFPIGMCMLHSVYSFFKRCGLILFLSSAGLGGLGTKKKSLTGGDVKEVINFHQKLYEAFL